MAQNICGECNADLSREEHGKNCAYYEPDMEKEAHMSAEERPDGLGARDAFEAWWRDMDDASTERLRAIDPQYIPSAAAAEALAAVKRFSYGTWCEAIRWDDGQYIIGREAGGVRIVAVVKIVALGANGIHTAQTNVASLHDDATRLEAEMPQLLVAGCGEAVREALAKMGYVAGEPGQLPSKVDDGPEEGVVM